MRDVFQIVNNLGSQTHMLFLCAKCKKKISLSFNTLKGLENDGPKVLNGSEYMTRDQDHLFKHTVTVCLH